MEFSPQINLPFLYPAIDAKREVMLTIMASLAQQESESISKNVKMGLKYRYQ